MGNQMSDDENSPEVSRSKFAVKSNDFVRFLEEKTPGSICPACKGDDWTLICQPNESADTYRLVTVMKDGSRQITLSTFAIYCDACGYVRTHLARHVRKWVDENPREPELDFGSPQANEAPQDE